MSFEITKENIEEIRQVIADRKEEQILKQLAKDIREKILGRLSSKEIAKLFANDAADCIAELTNKQQKAVISLIGDEEQSKEIRNFLWDNENTLAGLMAKEFVKVNEN